jgi:uncharacterized protein
MKIALVGPTGFIGSKVLVQASTRGHVVTAICRNPEKVPALPGVTPRRADILDRAQATAAFAGHDVVISCFNAGHHPTPGHSIYQDIIEGMVNLIKATKASGANRLIFVGGAGALYVRPGVQMIDTMPGIGQGELIGVDWPDDLASMMPPEFALWDDLLPADIKHEHIVPLVHGLMFFEHDRTYDWSFFSPPAGLHPGKGRGTYVAAGNTVPMLGDKYAGLSLEDAAIVLVDEAEANAHNHQHWTAYCPV